MAVRSISRRNPVERLSIAAPVTILMTIWHSLAAGRGDALKPAGATAAATAKVVLYVLATAAASAKRLRVQPTCGHITERQADRDGQ